jgi:hypothetical protein
MKCLSFVFQRLAVVTIDTQTTSTRPNWKYTSRTKARLGILAKNHVFDMFLSLASPKALPLLKRPIDISAFT